MGRSNRNQTFERARWHQVDCDYGCRASRLESATALRNSASFRDYGPANGGQQTFEPKRIYAVGDENSERPHCRRRVSVHAFGSCHIHGLNGTMMIIAL